MSVSTTSLADFPVELIGEITKNLPQTSGSLQYFQHDILNLRLVCTRLHDQIDELYYRRAHLFVHKTSYKVVEGFCRHIDHLTVWLPVFTRPEDAEDYYWRNIRGRGARAGLELLWIRHFRWRRMARLDPTHASKALDLSQRLGFVEAACGLPLRTCKEAADGPGQWSRWNWWMAQELNHLLPWLSPDVEIEVRNFIR